MANIKFTNLAKTELAADVLNTDTTVTVVDASVFPAINTEEYFIIVIINDAGEFEILRVTNVVDNTLSVTRSQEGTSAKSFTSGDSVEHRLTAESLITIVEEASITKAHESSNMDTYGHATDTLYSHVKITDETDSDASAILGIGISPHAVKTRFNEIMGAATETLLTTSGTFIVPETGTYSVTCIGGGGNGGHGATGGIGFRGDGNGECSYPTCNRAWGGGAGGGGGAGQTITQQIPLTKDDTVSYTIGGIGGITTFGTYITALAGGTGGNGTSASYGDIDSAFEQYGSAGTGGAAGVSYGSATTAGANGGYSVNVNTASVGNSVGGTPGYTTDGTYGIGGTGGHGGGAYITNLYSWSVYGGAVGESGTQGCIKLHLVLGA